MQPTCCRCGSLMRCAKTGHKILINDLQLWSSDRYECPVCKASVAISAIQPFAQQHENAFPSMVKAAEDSGNLTRVSDGGALRPSHSELEEAREALLDLVTHTDVKLLKEQRSFLIQMVLDLEREGKVLVSKEHAEDIEGVLNLLDNLVDIMHDKLGMDVLLREDL